MLVRLLSRSRARSELPLSLRKTFKVNIIFPDDHDFNSKLQSLRRLALGYDALYGSTHSPFYKEIAKAIHVEDLSFVVFESGNPICGICAYLQSYSQDLCEISYNKLPFIYLESKRCETESLKIARNLCRKQVEALLLRHPEATVYYRDFIENSHISCISKQLLEFGACASPFYTQIIDLSLPEAVLYSRLTKAFKWSVNWGRKNLQIKVLTANNVDLNDLMQFRLLHIQAAGRETRSLKSWEMQYEMIKQGEAFSVFAYNNNSLVSASLFPLSSSHCYYGVSASNRKLFEKPLNHCVIWTAIIFAKSLGLLSFEMGEQKYSRILNPTISSKELGISFFKRAFGGDTRLFLDVTLAARSMSS
jgi:hypothetical protein